MANSFNWSDLISRAGLSDPFAPDTSARNGRKALRKLVPVMETSPPDVAEIRDLTLPGPDGEVAARLYVPENTSETGPLTVFFHGGGYAFGDLESHHRVAQRLAAQADCRVLAIDYRLAPEHPFPAAYDDCLAALDWVAGEGGNSLGVDPDRIAVAGDSAGGGLAAAVAQARRDRIAFQLLIYPLMQLAETRKIKPKMLEGHMLSTGALDWIRDVYCQDHDPMDPRISPLFESDLTGLPPTFIAAAELDPLLDEGQAYRDRMQAAGVSVGYHLSKGLPHGFFNMTRIAKGAEKQAALAAAALKAGLSI
ncbi:alpha/beta hydrolase [Hyphobacterium sp.]|uniref:alpha/beta hydrolase n=1 Tax=Hyphobacterium sp. TaxID=2004662 RepID=UPI003748B312